MYMYISTSIAVGVIGVWYTKGGELPNCIMTKKKFPQAEDQTMIG